jgi:alpha-beta hydrolase superfamily lysophospholipase
MTRREAPFPSGEDTCAAWFYESPQRDATATVVMAHGASLTRADGLEFFAAAFARAGAHVLAFDHRNLGDSTGTLARRAQHAELHHLPHDHFSAFRPHSAVPARQVDFLRRTALRA